MQEEELRGKEVDLHELLLQFQHLLMKSNGDHSLRLHLAIYQALVYKEGLKKTNIEIEKKYNEDLEALNANPPPPLVNEEGVENEKEEAKMKELQEKPPPLKLLDCWFARSIEKWTVVDLACFLWLLILSFYDPQKKITDLMNVDKEKAFKTEEEAAQYEVEMNEQVLKDTPESVKCEFTKLILFMASQLPVFNNLMAEAWKREYLDSLLSFDLRKKYPDIKSWKYYRENVDYDLKNHESVIIYDILLDFWIASAERLETARATREYAFDVSKHLMNQDALGFQEILEIPLLLAQMLVNEKYSELMTTKDHLVKEELKKILNNKESADAYEESVLKHEDIWYKEMAYRGNKKEGGENNESNQTETITSTITTTTTTTTTTVNDNADVRSEEEEDV